MGLYAEELPTERNRHMLDARQRRREALLSRLGVVEVFVLLDESVLMRPVGGEKVFTAQLRELYDLATAGKIRLRMVPYALTAPMTTIHQGAPAGSMKA
jgi:hypothetical protein